MTEGKRLEPNSLIVGSPARAIKTGDVAAMLKMSAAHYVAKAKQFAGELRRVD